MQQLVEHLQLIYIALYVIRAVALLLQPCRLSVNVVYYQNPNMYKGSVSSLNQARLFIELLYAM